MESSVSTSELLRTIRSDPDNASCADCGRENPQYASISHGSLICKSCYQAHTKLGQGISRTRDLKSSQLSVIDLKFLILGGNSRLRNFFSIYQFPSKATIQYKYQTPVSHYYREMLRCLVFNEAIEFEKPNPVEGSAIYVAQKETQRRNSQKMKKRGILSSIRRFFSRSYHGLVNYGNAVSMRLNDRVENSCFKKLEEELIPHMDKLANTGRDMFYGMANVMSKIYIKLRRKQAKSKRNDTENSKKQKESVDIISIELKDFSTYHNQSVSFSQSPIPDTNKNLNETLNLSYSPSKSSKSPPNSHLSQSEISINPAPIQTPKLNSLENSILEASPSDPLPFASFPYSKTLENSESRETEPELEYEEMEEMPEILGSDEFEVLEEDEEVCE
jgi:hypothetical protein